MSKQPISTDKAPAPVSLFSQAIVRNDMVYCSGMVGLDPKTNKLVDGGVTGQTTQLLHNLAQVLEASGSRLENVLKMNVYILSMDEFGAMNEGYKPFFPGVLPPAFADLHPVVPLLRLSKIVFYLTNFNLPPSSFLDDYSEGAHPQILEKLLETNLSQQKPYGDDEYSEKGQRMPTREIGVS
ncbi:mmf1 [Ilyonectria robusta]